MAVASTRHCHYDPSMTPFTGAEFLDSLRDGREIWIYGQRVKEVTTHPAFRNPARMLARLYDALHDPAQREVLTCPTDTGSGGYTHKFFRAARIGRSSVQTGLPTSRRATPLKPTTVRASWSPARGFGTGRPR